MSIHINCPNRHILSSLKLAELSAQVPISTRAAPREHPSPTPDISDIPIDGAMRRVLPPELRHREKAQHYIAKHSHGHHFPGQVVNSNFAGSLNLPVPHDQSQQFPWEIFGILTRENGEARYAIHRAVQYAYEKGYEDARKSRGKYDSFKKVLDKTDNMESGELKDRLVRESNGRQTYEDVVDLKTSRIRELLRNTRGAGQRHQGGHRERKDRKRRDKSRARSHHHRSPRRNQRKRRNRSEDSNSSGSDDEDYYSHRGSSD